jgi:sugar lactone lactonase YvrE
MVFTCPMLKPEPIGKRASDWGEGPFWHEGILYYVDIRGEAVIAFDPGSEEEKIWEVGQQVGFVVTCVSGRLLYGGENGLYFLNRENGTSQPITDPEPDQKGNRFNDGKTSPDGRLFAGTISGQRLPEAALYRLDPDLSCHQVHSPVTNSNGIVWSPEGTTCYYIDTPSKEIKAFPYDQTTGALGEHRVVVETTTIEGSPDGMAIDQEGNLWVAFCHGGCVIQFDPSSGKILQRLDVPAVETTACAFGGPEMRTLYITTGKKSADDEALGGRLFVIEDAGVCGLEFPAFDDRSIS